MKYPFFYFGLLCLVSGVLCSSSPVFAQQRAPTASNSLSAYLSDKQLCERVSIVNSEGLLWDLNTPMFKSYEPDIKDRGLNGEICANLMSIDKSITMRSRINISNIENSIQDLESNIELLQSKQASEYKKSVSVENLVGGSKSRKITLATPQASLKSMSDMELCVLAKRTVGGKLARDWSDSLGTEYMAQVRYRGLTVEICSELIGLHSRLAAVNSATLDTQVQFNAGARAVQPSVKQDDQLAKLGQGSRSPWVSTYVIAKLDGIKLFHWNNTNSSFSGIEIEVNAGGKKVNRTEYVLTPKSNLDIEVPVVTDTLTSCSIGLNRDTGEWLKVKTKFVAPEGNFMARLKNKETVPYELIDYDLKRLTRKPSC